MEDTMTLVYYCLCDDFFVKPSTACSRKQLRLYMESTSREEAVLYSMAIEALGPAWGDDVVYLQEEEVVEVVVYKKRREHH